MDKYIVKGRIGEGAHGVVLKGINKSTMQVVALKRIPLKNTGSGLPNSALRELMALRLVNHAHTIRFFDYFPQGYALVLVCEYLPSDLWEMMRSNAKPLSPRHIKSYLWMLVSAIDYIHGLGIMHRDLKPANLLIGPDGGLKVADFGLCRLFDKTGSNREYTHQVASRWYRAPELLYGARNYGPQVDLWAIGCIFGEMFKNAPLFPGENDIAQLCIVIQALGTPNENNWPGVSQLPDFHKISFIESHQLPLEQLLPDISTFSRKLLERLLIYNPQSRITTKEVLADEYFDEDPQMSPLSEMPKPTKKVSNSELNMECVNWDWSSNQF